MADKPQTEPVDETGSGNIGAYRLVRVAASLALMTFGNSAMYATIVMLYPLAQEFDIPRADASIPYMFFMLGFGLGGVVIGRISDRIGIFYPVAASAFCLALALYLASLAENIYLIGITAGFMAGFLGSATTFGPLIADISHWFNRRRGMAVGIVISSNYLAGTIWPPVLQHFIDQQGWRATLVDAAIIILLAMLPLSLLLLRKSPVAADLVSAGQTEISGKGPPRLSQRQLQCLVCAAGIGCCVAMAMPQVHLVAYAVDLGYAAARGAEMLSLMLGCGIVSRLLSGWISDRIGGLKTLILGSALQMAVLAIFLTGDSMTALYFFCALFGLSQGGIVPSYTIIVRTYFSASQAGWRIGLALLFTMIGMAFGGWIAGALYDLTGSYTLSFINAIGFNIINLAIACYIYRRMHPKGGALTEAPA